MNALMKLGLAALTAAIAFAEDKPDLDLGLPPAGFVWARYIGGEDHSLFPAFTAVGDIVAVSRNSGSSLGWKGNNSDNWCYKDEWLDFVDGRPGDV